MDVRAIDPYTRCGSGTEAAAVIGPLADGLHTLRLAAPRTAFRVAVPEHTFATPCTGRLTVRLATHGRLVRLEGLGVATG